MTAALAVEGLSVSFDGVAVVRGVSFAVPPGGAIGVVGESGSGKSMTALAAMGLLPARARAQGRVLLQGENMLTASESRLCRLRGSRIGMVFQEPMTSLNPVHRIGDQVAEPLILHKGMSRDTAWEEAIRLLDRVGVPRAAERARSYPHELSGGQRQRATIAIAVACGPAALIADEPTSALDVTVQAQIVRLLKDLIAASGMALVLISHDLGVVGQIAERVAVLYGGKVVEEGPTEAVFRRARHPYTRGLLAASPNRRAGRGRRLASIPGVVPLPAELPPGCPFFGRCARGDERCRAEAPPEALGEAGQVARCFHPEPTP